MKNCLIAIVLLMPIGAVFAETQLEEEARKMGITTTRAPAIDQPKPTAACPAGKFIDFEKFRKSGLQVTELSSAAKKNVIRYLDKTEGNPPNLSKIPGYQMHFSHDTSGAFIENGYYVTPPSQGVITISRGTCLFYRIDGTTASLNRIVSGTWSLSSQ